MKEVDMESVDVIQSGGSWTFEQPPCSKGMIPYLERNESLVTWVQPKGGAYTDQFPVMRVGGRYYTMSLRMMKAVWRSVRLRKGFVNVERARFGGDKLRIPSILLEEKMRTQTRFNSMRTGDHHHTMVTSSECTSGEVASRGKKTMLNAASKVVVVIEKMLLPLLDVYVGSHVSFFVADEQTEFDFLDQVQRQHPGAMTDLETFVEYARGLFERYQSRDT